MDEGCSKRSAYCAARFCKNTSRWVRNMSFFKFPKDPVRARKWAIAAAREDLLVEPGASLLFSRYRMCGAHFETKMYLNDLRNRLHTTAIPTIFPALDGSTLTATIPDHTYSVSLPERNVGLVDNSNATPSVPHETPDKTAMLNQSPLLRSRLESLPEPTVEVITIITTADESSHSTPEPPPSASCQITPKLSAGSPRENKLRQKILLLRKKNRNLTSQIARQKKKLDVRHKELLDNITLEEYQKLTFKFCDNVKLATFVNMQIAESSKQPKGRRFSQIFKQNCLELYLAAPKIYKTALQEVFCLPSPASLAKVAEESDSRGK